MHRKIFFLTINSELATISFRGIKALKIFFSRLIRRNTIRFCSAYKLLWNWKLFDVIRNTLYICGWRKINKRSLKSFSRLLGCLQFYKANAEAWISRLIFLESGFALETVNLKKKMFHLGSIHWSIWSDLGPRAYYVTLWVGGRRDGGVSDLWMICDFCKLVPWTMTHNLSKKQHGHPNLIILINYFTSNQKISIHISQILCFYC